MTKALPILTDEEVRTALPAADEAGFGALATPKGLLPLKALDVQTRIDGLLAQTALCQTFVNPFTEPLEATYIFPLPDRAAVTRFRMEVAGRVIEGILKERGAARRDYEQALQEGRRAAITEEERPGVFTLRVGNLQPGEEAMIRLTLTGPLAYSDGEATYRFPLVVAPRYIPGTPLPGSSVGDGVAPDTDAVPDASRITPPVLLPGFPNPVRLSLAVDVHAGGLPVGAFRTSLHAVVVEKDGETARIALQCGERLNRDFILRFRVGDRAVQTSLVLQPDAAAETREGTFLLTVVPPVGQARSLRPRDLVFVLDRSGSMGGWKMVAARRALARMVDTLTERDRFTVYAFDDAVETPPSFGGTGLVPATDRNRFRAVEFLARIDARNGTGMAQPLALAVQQLSGASAESAGEAPRDPILVLVTDGQVGNEDQILRTLGQHVRGLRVFTLGIDQAVNAAFLRRLACLGGGSCELVESEDRLDEVMDKLHRRIGTPVLTGLRLEPDGLQIDPQTLTPARLPDLFAGAPLVVLGRYRGAARGSIRIQARDAAGRSWTESAPAQAGDSAAVSAVWARAHVRELEDRYVIGHGDLRKLEKAIVQTSLQFGVLCRFTAFVAVDVKEVVNPGGEVHRVIQPVEPAAGWAMLGTDEDADASPAGAVMQCLAAPPPDTEVLYQEESAADVCGGFVDSFLMDFDEAAPASPQPPFPAAPMPPKARARAIPPQKQGGRLPNRSPEATDLGAYRRRALDLLQRLQQAGGVDPAARLTELGILAMQLADLIEDIRSVGAAATEVRPLEELLKDLQDLMAAGQPAAAAIEQLWLRAEKVLEAFAHSKSSPGGKRAAFWK